MSMAANVGITRAVLRGCKNVCLRPRYTTAPQICSGGIRVGNLNGTACCAVAASGSILVITIVENVDNLMNSSAPAHSRFLYLRVAVATVLLIPAIWFSLQTINGLTARRSLREDLAEITHARYGILSADKWRGI